MRHDRDGGPRQQRNWFLLLAIVLCLEFWAIVTSSLASTL
jgi:hypothetical protein